MRQCSVHFPLRNLAGRTFATCFVVVCAGVFGASRADASCGDYAFHPGHGGGAASDADLLDGDQGPARMPCPCRGAQCSAKPFVPLAPPILLLPSERDPSWMTVFQFVFGPALGWAVLDGDPLDSSATGTGIFHPPRRCVA